MSLKVKERLEMGKLLKRKVGLRVFFNGGDITHILRGTSWKRIKGEVGGKEMSMVMRQVNSKWEANGANTGLQIEREMCILSFSGREEEVVAA